MKTDENIELIRSIRKEILNKFNEFGELLNQVDIVLRKTKEGIK